MDRNKIILLAIGTALAHLGIGTLMVLAWSWIFSGLLQSVLIILTVGLTAWNMLSQIPWVINKLKELN